MKIYNYKCGCGETEPGLKNPARCRIHFDGLGSISCQCEDCGEWVMNMKVKAASNFKRCNACFPAYKEKQQKNFVEKRRQKQITQDQSCDEIHQPGPRVRLPDMVLKGNWT